jgi:DNA-binding MarR family transcriptional regulator
MSRLEETGFIVRRPDADDRRIRRVRLTAKARRVEPQIRATMDRWSRMLTEGFSARQHESALKLLRRMAENARAAVRPKGD